MKICPNIILHWVFHNLHIITKALLYRTGFSCLSRLLLSWKLTAGALHFRVKVIEALNVRERRWKTVGFLYFCRWDGWHSQAEPWQYNIKGGFLYSERGQARLTESGPSIFIHFKSCYSDTNVVNIFSNLFSSCFDQTVPEDSSLLCLCEKYIFRPIFSLRLDYFYSVSLLI